MIFETKSFEEYQYLRNLSLSATHQKSQRISSSRGTTTRQRIVSSSLEEEILGDERSDRIILAVGRLLGYAGAERGTTGLGSG